MLLFILLAAALLPEPGVRVFSQREYPKPVGVQKILVIPVEFKDSSPSVPLDILLNILARMKDYFVEVSYGKVSLEVDMFEDWVTLPHEMAYYGRDSEHPGDDRGGNARGSRQLVFDVISQVDGGTDFSEYAHLILVHSGEDQAESSPNALNDNVWSYSYWSMSVPTRDGVPVTAVSIVSESSPLGVWVHEYLHQLGELPDLWSVDDRNNHYMGAWSPMDMGITLGVPRGSSPPHLTSWGKIQLGWLEPVILPLNDTTVIIAPLESTLLTVQRAVMLPLPDGTRYLIEAREREGFDSHLPDEGVLIYHIDEMRGEPIVRIVPREEDDMFKVWAAYRVGDLFIDEFNNLNIEVISKSLHGYEIRISVNQEPSLEIETPHRVSILQPFDVTVKTLAPTVDPRLNLFIDEELYESYSDHPDGEYSVEVRFALDQVGDHVIRVVVVDPVLGTRYEAARHIYVEMPSALLTVIGGLTLVAVITLGVFAVRRRRRGKMDGLEF